MQLTLRIENNNCELENPDNFAVILLFTDCGTNTTTDDDLRSFKMEEEFIQFLKNQFKERINIEKQNKHLLLSSNWYK